MLRCCRRNRNQISQCDFVWPFRNVIIRKKTADLHSCVSSLWDSQIFVELPCKKCTSPETAIIYAVKKLIVTTISTAGTTLLNWNKAIIFHGYKVENYHCKMKSYPKFPFSHIMLFIFPLIASQLHSFSSNVGSFIADRKIENMCLENQLLKCKQC